VEKLVPILKETVQNEITLFQTVQKIEAEIASVATLLRTESDRKQVARTREMEILSQIESWLQKH